jgi:diguanylate cyclase (GGDEF)-like protein
VLCVTENRAFLNRLRSSLADAGFSVVICRTAAEAYEMLAVSKFDVVVLDQALSRTDGLSVWREIRRGLARDAPPTLIAVEHWDAALLGQVVAAEAAGMVLTSARGEEIIRQVIDVMKNPVRRTVVEEALGERVLDGGIDPVTRIANAQHFSRRLVGESVAAYREGHNLAVLMVSIDQFEILAERHGRQRIDDLLAQAARVIEGDLRSRDCAARYSDRIFGVLLAEADLQAAAAVGRRLQRTLANTEFGDLDHPIAITVSIGAACRTAGTLASPDEIAGHALDGCAAAGKLGGNRLVADRVLTGRPLVLVCCSDPRLREGIADCLSRGQLEVRQAGSGEEARRMLAEVPVALLLALAVDGAAAVSEPLELLSWVREKLPATRRVLATPRLDLPSAVRAVNEADIQWLLALPWSAEAIADVVDRLVHG